MHIVEMLLLNLSMTTLENLMNSNGNHNLNSSGKMEILKSRFVMLNSGTTTNI